MPYAYYRIASIEGKVMQANIDGTKVRTLRAGKFQTQTQLAEKAGIRVETLCRLECGRRPARFSTVLKLADALGVKPEEIVVTK